LYSRVSRNCDSEKRHATTTRRGGSSCRVRTRTPLGDPWCFGVGCPWQFSVRLVAASPRRKPVQTGLLLRPYVHSRLLRWPRQIHTCSRRTSAAIKPAFVVGHKGPAAWPRMNWRLVRAVMSAHFHFSGCLRQPTKPGCSC